MLRLSRVRARTWALVAGTVVTALLAGLLAWSLPAALALEDRAADVGRLEVRLSASEREAALARGQARTAEARVEALRAEVEEVEAERRTLGKRVRTLRSRARDLAMRVSDLGG